MRWLVLLAACGSSDPSVSIDAAPATYDAPSGLALPPANGAFDYQLGGAYPPPSGVVIVSRDRKDTPAAGLYNICYVNGFQIQPDETATWSNDLVLHDGRGKPVIDAQWNEMLIDVSTPTKRTAVAAIIGGWIEGCHSAGFDAVEIDNLDSYARSQGLLTEDDNVAAMALFSAAAHAKGMAIAQKNSTELVPRRAELATDFVTAEECNRYDECDAYLASYDRVLMIEYRQQDFTAGCTKYPKKSLVLRDLDLVPAGAQGYAFSLCP